MGPAVVRSGTVCIDATEVTVEQYARFVNAGFSGAPTAECPSPDSGGAVQCTRPTALKPPVTCVDWCEARAFCTWSGKRLCGSKSGGVLAAGDLNIAKVDQWFAACSLDGTRVYPYGDSYRPEACNTENSVSGPSSVEVHASCTSSAAGPFDMSGNVAEWIDSCSGAGDGELCMHRGGQYKNSGKDAACKANGSVSRRSKYPDLGFRCCAD